MEIWENLSLEDMEDEVWKDIEGYEGLYQVSNMGRVKSLEKTCNTHNRKGEFCRTVKERIRKQTFTSRGYLQVCLSKKGVHKHYRIHRIVAKTFIENPCNKKTVDHINTIITDNRLCNLKWATQSEQFTDNKISRERMRKARSTTGKRVGKMNQKFMIEPLKKKVKCITTNKVFDSLSDAARYYNLNHSNISRCCTGKAKYCGRLEDGTKMRWQFIID